MKRIMISLLSMLVCLSLSSVVFAGEAATKDECIAMCKKAVQMAKDKGVEEMIKQAGDPKGPFVWKDSYIFVSDLTTKRVVAHPEKPGLVGKDMSGIKDAKGKMFYLEILNIAGAKGDGWVDYVWPKPDTTAPVPKSSYVLKVPNKPYAVIAGYYH